MSIKILKTFGLGHTPTQALGTVTAPSQQTSISDLTNIRYARTFVLNNGFIILSHSNISAGIALSDLALALTTLEPSLTWPPVIITQPLTPQHVTAPTPVSFQFVVSSEVDVSYQWEISTDGGATWNPVCPPAGTGSCGVYSGVTIFQLSISNSTGLNGNQYRCTAQNVAGVVTSNPAVLFVP